MTIISQFYLIINKIVIDKDIWSHWNIYGLVFVGFGLRNELHDKSYKIISARSLLLASVPNNYKIYQFHRVSNGTVCLSVGDTNSFAKTVSSYWRKDEWTTAKRESEREAPVKRVFT